MMHHFLQFYLDARALEATDVWDDPEQLAEVRRRVRDELATAIAMVQRIEERLVVLDVDQEVREQFKAKVH